MNVFELIAVFKKELGYTYNEIMYEMPYISLMFQLISLTATKKEEIKETKEEKEDKLIDFLSSI